MKSIYEIIIGLLLVILFGACDLEKEISIELPEYESKYVVECYLEPGQPFQLLLSRSTAYFSPFDTSASDLLRNLLVSDAEVNIMHQGINYRLSNRIVLNAQRTKLYNYFNGNLVPSNFEDPFELSVKLPGGTTILAETKILPPVPFDSIVVEFNETDTLARVLTYYADPPMEKNYYRRMLHRNNLDSIAIQDFSLDDRFVEDVVVFGSTYEFEIGDTIINTLFHIDRSYFDFLESVNNAVISNGNPFGQPNPINSKLGGTARAIGIFTGLSYSREHTIVEDP